MARSSSPKVPRQRLDRLLVDRGLVESRARAQALVMAGSVFSGDTRLTKPGHSLPQDAPLEVRGRDHPWVSRGGLKLKGAVDAFDLDFTDRVVVDVGASTGGFTDVTLAHGAARVYAVDVGHGQLAWSLRQDPRVHVLERTNARYLDSRLIPEPVGAIVCDASFISLKTVLPAALALAAPGALLVALIKPQFEVGRDQVGKGGVVRDPGLHDAVVADMRHWLNHLPGWRVRDVCASPITGPEGNREFLIVADRAGEAGE
ncbi:TlyA family RNA methyltransferase [Yunchengibacter salinarum]|uniref:TlyA family RNA methyltransferase n=1 Tax=Yunchengibacter salinarum TaxID=3133399 RepID=UPI0035B63174